MQKNANEKKISKKEMNKMIVTDIRKTLQDQGIHDKFDVYPIENTATKRNRHFTNADGKKCFALHMWSVNSLPEKERNDVINRRIKEGRKHFNI